MQWYQEHKHDVEDCWNSACTVSIVYAYNIILTQKESTDFHTEAKVLLDKLLMSTNYSYIESLQ